MIAAQQIFGRQDFVIFSKCQGFFCCVGVNGNKARRS
jgi:hypothetical protein